MKHARALIEGRDEDTRRRVSRTHSQVVGARYAMAGLTVGSVVASAIGSGVLSAVYARRVRRLWELVPWTNAHWLSRIWGYAGGPVGIVTACARATTGRRDLPEREVAAAAEVYHYLRARNGNVFGHPPSVPSLK